MTVIVTGASRSIGAATARLFAENGWNTVINYHTSKDSAQALCDELTAAGHSACLFKADVSSRSEVEGMVSDTLSRFGRIDALVNNAGVAHYGLFSDMSEAELKRLFSVNLGGVFNCTRAVLPDMIHRKSGCIINLSSMWGIAGASCEAAYSASKAAIIGFSKAMAKELGPSGIRVNCVAPGVIDTDMNRALGGETLAALAEDTPLGRLGTPEDVASLIHYLVSPQAGFITGQVISPNGGFLI